MTGYSCFDHNQMRRPKMRFHSDKLKYLQQAKNYLILPFIMVSCMILVIAFLNGCSDDDEEEDDEFINPLSTVIGSQGGTALSADGNAMVEIPAGAVSSVQRL